MLNRGLLESAIALPHQPYYETFYDGLAAMVRSIAANHALEDGNKRLAVTVLHSTLLLNGYTYSWGDDDAADLMIRCAAGETEYEWLSLFIEAWTAKAPPVSLAAPAIEEAIRVQREALQRHPPDFIGSVVTGFLRGAITAHARGEVPTEVVRQFVEMLRQYRSAN